MWQTRRVDRPVWLTDDFHRQRVDEPNTAGCHITLEEMAAERGNSRKRACQNIAFLGYLKISTRGVARMLTPEIKKKKLKQKNSKTINLTEPFVKLRTWMWSFCSQHGYRKQNIGAPLWNRDETTKRNIAINACSKQKRSNHWFQMKKVITSEFFNGYSLKRSTPINLER